MQLSRMNLVGRDVAAHTDILAFAQGLQPDLFERMATCPDEWVGKLRRMREKLGHRRWESYHAHLPPDTTPGFQRIAPTLCIVPDGDGWHLFHFRPWFSEQPTWGMYEIKRSARIYLLPEFKDIDSQALLPQHLAKHAKLVKGDKRAIYRMSVLCGEKAISLYAKESEIEICTSMYHTPALSGPEPARKADSFTEMKRTLELAKLGVNVPQVIGLYCSEVEDYLYVADVGGRQPPLHSRKYRDLLIEEDAKILAGLCKAGYRKDGFCDADDKRFDGERLYLIDVDELEELFTGDREEYLRYLLTRNGVREFRNVQMGEYKHQLENAIEGYSTSLLRRSADRRHYRDVFFRALKE